MAKEKRAGPEPERFRAGYLIVGNSAAGINAIEALRPCDQNQEIVLIDEEKGPVYSRPLLSYYLSGEVVREKLLYRPSNFYKKNGVKTLFGEKVVKIDPEKKKVVLSDGSQVFYKKLLLTVGASPTFPKIKGVGLKGVFGVRKMKDIQGILERLGPLKKAGKSFPNVVFIGGGFVSLRTAYALSQRKCKINLVVSSSTILSRTLDLEGAEILEKWLKKQGFEILTKREVVEIKGKDEVKEVVLDNSQRLEADLVIIGKGVSPNTTLAKEAGLKVNRGIAVNEYLQTSDPQIFAAGDVAETFDLSREEKVVNALWPCATEQGYIAGLNMAGVKREYEGSLSQNSLEFFGLPLITAGLTSPPKGDGFETIVKRDLKKNYYKKLTLKGNKVKGLILLGDIDQAGLIISLIKEKVDVSSFKEDILEEGFGLIRLPEALRTKKIGEVKESKRENLYPARI